MHKIVSVIVPVYNVAQYLDRCVRSLTAQSDPNIEILLIDDGSTDGSGALCDTWAARDPRIRAFHKTNGGLSDARNYGLERATGAYICFIDSDDWLDPRFVEVMRRALLETDSDLVECDYLRTDSDSPSPQQTQSCYPRETFSGRECLQEFLETTFFVSVWNKLYRAEVLRDEKFRVGVYHEDEYWTYKIFSYANRVCRLNYTGYFYYQRPGSIVHTTPSHKRLTDAFVAGRERIEFLEQHRPDCAALGYSKMLYTCMFLYSEAERGDFPEKAALQQELRVCFQSTWIKYLKKRQYRKEMWRFFWFSLLPKHYCTHNY